MVLGLPPARHVTGHVQTPGARATIRPHGATLAPKTKKPFDALVEGLHLTKSRGDRI